MRLSVVVPALDEGAHIDAALRSVVPLRRDGHEVVVVDGGSRDDTVARAQPLADLVVHAPRGRSSQLNAGAALSRGDVLLFLHADTRLPEGAAAAIARALARGRAWGRFDVAIEGRSPLLPFVASLMNLRSRATGIATGDQGMFVARELFVRAGGFPRIPLMEDVALSRTLLRLAGRPACLPDRVVTSGRRWDGRGALRTIATMWALRHAFWRGEAPGELARRYGTPMPTKPPTLIVFAKEPRPGHAKRRLAATIGPMAAADVHRELVERTLAVAVAARAAGIVDDVELWCDPDADAFAFREWSARFRVARIAQQGEDLGKRMQVALGSALARGRPGLLVGTDCPLLDVPYLGAAAAALGDVDAVVGPAEDGGYVLIGLARPLAAFAGIAWGTAGVMAATRVNLAGQRASWRELPALFDVDVADDLARWRAIAPPQHRLARAQPVPCARSP